MRGAWDARDALVVLPDDIRDHVGRTLKAVEAAHGVRVLFAAESGSRAWGFGSPDSDYDVRFIYAHEPKWYLGLSERRDVIERPLDDRLVDLAGWDVRKAVGLLLKSNPALYEWFVSPIVYGCDGVFAPRARDLFERHASARALAAHYWSIARGQWQREISGRERVKLKKYFYVVRPLLSLQAVLDRGGPPPMDIEHLLGAAAISEDVRRAIDDLLLVKRETPELGLGARIAVIDSWAESQIQDLAPEKLRLADAADETTRREADVLFRDTIGLGQL